MINILTKLGLLVLVSTSNLLVLVVVEKIWGKPSAIIYIGLTILVETLLIGMVL